MPVDPAACIAADATAPTSSSASSLAAHRLAKSQARQAAQLRAGESLKVRLRSVDARRGLVDVELMVDGGG